MRKKNKTRHYGRGGSRGGIRPQDEIITDVPIVFQGQIIPGLTGEFQYRQGYPHNNLNAMFLGLSFRFFLRNEHAVVERIKEMFPDLFDTPNKVPQMIPISDQNFESQGYINYEIYDTNSQTFTSSPPPPSSPVIDNTLAAIARARPLARDRLAREIRARELRALELPANNTPPISRVPSVATNARIEPMVERNREQNIGQVIPDVMGQPEKRKWWPFGKKTRKSNRKSRNTRKSRK